MTILDNINITLPEIIKIQYPNILCNTSSIPNVCYSGTGRYISDVGIHTISYILSLFVILVFMLF